MKSTKQKEKREMEVGGEEDRMKNRMEKERKKSWDQVLKPKYCVGTDPVHWYIIGILVTSATTGHGGSVVSALASQAKGRGSILVAGAFFPTSIFYLPFPTSVQ